MTSNELQDRCSALLTQLECYVDTSEFETLVSTTAGDRIVDSGAFSDDERLLVINHFLINLKVRQFIRIEYKL